MKANFVTFGQDYNVSPMFVLIKLSDTYCIVSSGFVHPSSENALFARKLISEFEIISALLGNTRYEIPSFIVIIHL